MSDKTQNKSSIQILSRHLIPTPPDLPPYPREITRHPENTQRIDSHALITNSKSVGKILKFTTYKITF